MSLSDKRFDGCQYSSNTWEHGALAYTVIVLATASDPAASQFYAPFAVLQSVNFSAIRVVMPLSFTMTFPNRQYRTGSLSSSSSVLQDVKHIPEMFLPAFQTSGKSSKNHWIRWSCTENEWSSGSHQTYGKKERIAYSFTNYWNPGRWCFSIYSYHVIFN